MGSEHYLRVDMLYEVRPNLSVARQALIPRCPSFQLQHS